MLLMPLRVFYWTLWRAFVDDEVDEAGEFLGPCFGEGHELAGAHGDVDCSFEHVISAVDQRKLRDAIPHPFGVGLPSDSVA